ncbi:hypothetical protein ACFWP0_06080 [Achromobacter sp. NPDC058515]|uniref:hypothetical protein n=1 Tax=Achromobacter sp. NPDC058515 TaxID=3346533 RepID=UPI00365609F9
MCEKHHHASKRSILDHGAELRAKIEPLGYTCLDETWRGAQAAYRFRCPQGHVFSRQGQGAVRSGVRCPTCMQDAQTWRLHVLAREAGVICLESQWLGGMAKHRFQCAHGHHWERKGRKALEFPGCARCARERGLRRRLADGLQRLRKMATERGGACLAERFEGAAHAYPFRCARGHTWQAKGSEVLRRTWCPTCAVERKVNDYRRADGLERLQAIAARQGGECLNSAYAGGTAFYRFRCREGHVWETTGARLLRGNWCAACAYENKRLGLDAARLAAAERGGQCLTTQYRNNEKKLPWLCHRGHTWHAPLASIRAGHWCPECAHMNQITNPNSKAWMRYRLSSVGKG